MSSTVKLNVRSVATGLIYMVSLVPYIVIHIIWNSWNDLIAIYLQLLYCFVAMYFGMKLVTGTHFRPFPERVMAKITYFAHLLILITYSFVLAQMIWFGHGGQLSSAGDIF